MSKGKILKNVASLGIVQVANLILPLISIPVISRIIGPEKFGVVNYAATFVGYFTLLIDYGFNFTATRKISQNPENKELRNLVFSEVIYAKIFLFIISVFLFLIALYYVEPLCLEKKVAIFTFLTCIATVFTQNWFFQAMQDLSNVALLNFLSKLLFTVFVLLLVRHRYDYIWIPLLTSLVTVLVSFISYYWGIKKYRIKLISVSLKRIIIILKEENLIFFSTVVISLYTTTNVVILGMLQSQEDVGFYTAAQKLIIIAMGVINMPLAQAFYPFIGNAFGESKEKGIQTVHKLLPIIVIFTILVGLGMLIFGSLGIKMLYGKQFLPSIPVFNILIIIPLLVGLSNIFGIQIMMNLKMDKIFFYITSGGSILGILLNVIMTYWLGYIGTAWNWVLVECYITITMYLVLRKKDLNPIDWKQFRFSELKLYSTSFINKIKKRK